MSGVSQISNNPAFRVSDRERDMIGSQDTCKRYAEERLFCTFLHL